MKKADGIALIHGPCGTGKTYFCSSLIEYLPNSCLSFRAYNERDLMQRIRDGIRENSSGDYIKNLHHLIDDDFIIIDDIGSSGHTDWREEILMEAIDYRYRNKKLTLFTSNLGKKEFTQVYGDRISSRLFAKENTIVNMSGMTDFRSQGE